MENVVAFNNELSSLYESKPPISKAKMASITKAAMRAIKFYKHVVQSVEKFILKCKPEYKVPGLYVIDSIVRQSRHQFGPEKDVFAPRFARNVKETFANLFRCAPEDKSRIIRVLNLWQKNNVFAPEVIQPIFDLADPNHPIYQLPPGGNAGGPTSSGAMGDMSAASANGLNSSGVGLDMNMSGMGPGGAGHGGGEDKLGNLPDLSNLSHEKAQSVLDNSTLRQLEHMQHYLKRQTASTTGSATATSKTMRESHSCDNIHMSSSTKRIHHPETYSKYTKGAHEPLYYDRNSNTEDNDDSAEVDSSSPKHTSKKILDNNNLQQLLNDPNVLRQLQTLQNFQKIKQQEEKRLQEEAFEKHYQNALKTSGPMGVGQDGTDFSKEVEFISEEQKIEVINLDGNDSRSPTPDRDRYNKRRRSSRSRSRSRDRRDRRGRRSRSRSRSRSPRSNRRRTSRERIRDKEREREHERERRRKGLPDLRKEHLSVCSTTLWVGHLSKLVYQEELSDTFGEYGDIVSIDQIVPRGCAFIVMNRRQDAHKAMQALKNHKLQGRAITISWAAGKGVKSKEWKDFWDLELGVTYIPWNKLDENTDFDSLEEGGMFDEDSMPGWMKDKIRLIKSQKEKTNEVMSSIPPPSVPPPSSSTGGMLFGIDTTQPPPGPPPSIMPMVPGQFSMAPPMGGPPRMLGPPMGMPMPGPGMPMPPSMVPGMPPPHPMMPPMGMMPPGFPPIPGPVGGPTHMGLPPGGTQFPPPPVAPAMTAGNLPANAIAPTSNSNNMVSSDDQMDIEMEDADEQTTPQVNTPIASAATASQLNFSQPPPLFGNISAPGTENGSNGVSDEPFTRDRNRGQGGGSRWSGADNDTSGENNGGPSRWRDINNGAPLGGPNGMPNFNDGRNQRGPVMMNMPPMDMNNPPQRPDFMGDFDNRGPRGGRGGNHNNDFFPNMQNRFNQPTSLMQMRIPPPNSFNPRMGGPGGGPPPMFMRGGPGGPGGPGNRQQGPGGYFNPRNPFDRDVGPMTNMRGGRGGGRGRGGRGGQMGSHGSGNWSDDDMDDNFKRRGGPSGNRFRDRNVDGNDDRYNRGGGERNAGGRRGGRAGSRERSGSDFDRERDRDRDRESRDRDQRDRSSENRRRLSREERNSKSNSDRKSHHQDTEEDWDAELKEYDARNENTENTPVKRPALTRTSESEKDDLFTRADEEENTYRTEQPSCTEESQTQESLVPEYTGTEGSTLYDELPAPVMAMNPEPPAEDNLNAVHAMESSAPERSEVATESNSATETADSTTEQDQE